MKKTLLVFFTRPKAIKMHPLVEEFQRRPGEFKMEECITGQHREKQDQVLKVFEIKPDSDLNITKQGQGLYDVTAKMLPGMRDRHKEIEPDLCIRNPFS